MTFVPIVSSPTADVDRFLIQSQPEQTGRLEGLFLSAVNTARENPTYQGWQYGLDLLQQHVNPGKWLDAKQAKELYPNVSFPHGGFSNVIRRVSEKKGQFDYNNDLLKNIEPGALSTLSRWTGNLIGFSLSPVNLATGGLGRFAVGAAEDALVARVGSSLIPRVLTKMGLGIGEVNAVMAPQETSSYLFRKHIQEPMTSHDVLYNIVGNSLFGGFAGAAAAAFKGGMNTIMGFRRFVPPDTEENILTAAKKQLQAGKKVDVEPLVKEGMARQLKIDPIPNDEELNRIEAVQRPKIEKEIDNISSQQDDLKTVVKNQAQDLKNDIDKSKTPNLLTIEEAAHTKDILNDFGENETTDLANSLTINSKPILDYEKFLQKSREKPEDINFKDKELHWSIAEKNIGENKDVVQDYVSKNEKKITRLQKKIERTKDKEARRGLEEKASSSMDELNTLNEHLDAIDKFGDKANPYRKKLQSLVNNIRKIHNLENQKAYHQDILDNTEVLRNLRDRKVELTKDELMNHYNSINNWRSTNFIDSEMARRIESKPEEIPMEDVRSFINDLKDSGQMNDDELQELTDIENDDKTHAKVRTALRDYMQCVIDGGAE